MDIWIKGIMSRLDRRKAEILFGEHAAKDKNLHLADIDNVVATIRHGKVDNQKSTIEKERICLKNYFSKNEQTYFAIVEYYSEFIKVITAVKKKGKY